VKYTRTGLLAVNPQAFLLEMPIAPRPQEPPFEVEGSAAVVRIRGMLTHHAESPCLDCYDGIQGRLTAAFDSDCPTVILRIDSLGGDVSGCFDLAAWIQTTAAARGKRVLAYAEGNTASAAYALACTAEFIGAGTTAFLGSIGIINAICDQTAADAAMGMRYIFATSGARKGDGNPHIPVTDDAVATLQRQVDELALVFYNHVSLNRGLSVEAVSGFEAGLFFGSGAVAARLADRVCSWTEMVSLASDTPQPKVTAMPKYLESAKELAVKMSLDGDDKEKAAAKRMLAAFEEDEKDAEDGKEKDDKQASAAAEEDEKKAAAAEAAGEEDTKEETKAAAAASAPSSFDLAREVQALKAERAAEKEALLRATLLATRPDFDPKMVAFLNTCTIDQVKSAVETFPKAPNLAAASQAAGTQGAAAGVPNLDPAVKAHIDSKMGMVSYFPGVTHHGTETEFGMMTPAQAKARLAVLEAAKGAR
jgi:ClpP class serine protease